MKTIRPQGRAGAVTRRHFLRAASTAGIMAAASGPPLLAQAPTVLKAAVIGHTGRGDYGHGLEGIFSNRPNIQVVGLADPDEAGRTKTAAKIGALRRYADYRELLAKERPQLVSLAMRQADQHHAIALEVLRSGAHLYCEKPFVTTPAEADELLAEAERRGLKIAVAHTMRLMPTVVRLKRAVAQGLIGEVVEGHAYGKQDARAGGEDMMVLGSHLFDLMRLLLGNPLACAARVTWQGRDITPADRRVLKDHVGFVAGDQVAAQFSFPKDVTVTFTSAGKLRETIGHWGLELLGSKGAARINCDIAPHAFVRRSAAWTASGRVESWEPLPPGAVQAPPEHNLGPVEDWLDAIAKNREPECSGRNGAWAVEMVMGVYQSALASRRVTFPLPTRTHPLAA